MKPSLRDILEATADYWEATPERRAQVCNGVGPAAWPKAARKLMDSGLVTFGMSFKDAADIHDWDWSIDADQKSYEHFVISNKRFLRNCRALVRRHTPWYLPILRRKRMLLAQTLYVAVKAGGWKHYIGEDHA